jgi:hypothetical protein
MFTGTRTPPERPRRGRPSNRRHVLDAAARVAMREGPGAVTIEAVVTESGMSRGGVLYHFRSKDALLQALVDQDIDIVREMTGLDSGEPARSPAERGHVALAVALANNPALLRTWAQVQRDLDEADAAGDDGDPVSAVVARLALDGLWFSDLVDRDRFSDDQRERVVSAILARTSRGSA